MKKIPLLSTAAALCCILLQSYTAFAAEINTANGIGQGADVPGNPLTDMVQFEKYTNFPTGITDGQSNFSTALPDGEGNIWLIPLYYAGCVVKFNTTDHSMTKYDSWPVGIIPYFNGAAFDNNGIIWLVPRGNQKSVVRLDPDTGEMTAYPHTAAVSAYMGAALDQATNTVWMVPFSYKQLIKIDANTSTVSLLDMDLSTVPNYTSGTFPFSGIVNDQHGYMWLIPYQANMVLRVRIADGLVQGFPLSKAEISTGQYVYNFSAGAYDGDRHIWMMPQAAGAIVSVDIYTGELTRYDNWPAGVTLGTGAFSGAAFDGRYLWASPAQANAVIRIDPATGKMKAYTQWAQAGIAKNTGIYFHGPCFDGSDVYMVSNNKRILLKISSGISFTLSTSPQEDIWLPEMVTIRGELRNQSGSGKISSVQWLRTPLSDTASYDSAAAFAAGFTTASPQDRDTLTIGTTETAAFTIFSGTNARYWFKATFTDATDSTSELYKSVEIDDIFTPSYLQVMGVSEEDEREILYTQSPYPSDYGIAFDLDSTILRSTDPLLVLPRDLSPEWLGPVPEAFTVPMTATDLGQVIFRYTKRPPARNDTGTATGPNTQPTAPAEMPNTDTVPDTPDQQTLPNRTSPGTSNHSGRDLAAERDGESPPEQILLTPSDIPQTGTPMQQNMVYRLLSISFLLMLFIKQLDGFGSSD